MKRVPLRAMFCLLKDWAGGERGASAAEFALWVTVMVIPFLNVMDLGFYVFRTMQVREAAQAGAQSVATICGYNGKTPAAAACTAVNTSDAIITAAVQSTSLSSKVCLGSAGAGSASCPITYTPAPQEGWYCSDTLGNLNQVSGTTNIWTINSGSPSTRPTCSGTTLAGDYVKVTVAYTYNPVFTAVSLINVLRTTADITQTAYMRIN